MVPSVYRDRHVLIQDLPENTAEVGTNSLSILVYEVSILRADAEQVEVQPAVAPCARKKDQTLLFSCKRLHNCPHPTQGNH